MSEKTIYETEATYGERLAGIVRGWHETQDEIASSVEPVEGPHVDILTAQQRAEVSRQQKAERAGAKLEEFHKEYKALTRGRNEAVMARTSALRNELLGVEDSGALALASDAGLGAMLELAVHAGNEDLARSVFVTASQRELGDLVNSYSTPVDPQARSLYEEYKAAPSEDSLERRLADAETIFSAPEASDYARVSSVA